MSEINSSVKGEISGVQVLNLGLYTYPGNNASSFLVNGKSKGFFTADKSGTDADKVKGKGKDWGEGFLHMV